MIKTIELFAGVGGFRLGLESQIKSKRRYEIVWSNQWEPATKIQHASDIYIARFGDKNHSCEDITKVIDKDFNLIPNHDLLVGGFPCQDYSVARTLSKASGIRGKKGVLWWSIHSILKKKGDDAPKFLMLENVERLLKSPSTQRGRDFAIMLASLSDLGYIVEWRVINAADYGMSQKRKRVFILAYRKNTSAYDKIAKLDHQDITSDWIINSGIMQAAFPMSFYELFFDIFDINGNLADISENHEQFNPESRPFGNAGIMIGRKVFTSLFNGKAQYDGKFETLGDVLIDEKDVSPEFYIPGKKLESWRAAKDSKDIPRTSKEGYEYNYSEGKMAFPDLLVNPSRTIVTGEGGKSVSRFKHVIKTESGKYRRLTPIELEKLNMFPPDWTKEASDTKRAFLMGNALVVGVVKKLAKSLYLASK